MTECIKKSALRDSCARVLTIRQPWACAIFFSGKNVENRTWTTAHRGTLLIHVSSAFDASSVHSRHVQRLKRRSAEHVALSETRSAIIGCVQLVDVVRNARSAWADADVYHWIISQPVVFKRPIQNVRGAMGLWRVNADVLRKA